MSRKHKASLRARAMEMNEARAERKRQLSEEFCDEQTAGSSGDSGESSSLDDLPTPVTVCMKIAMKKMTILYAQSPKMKFIN